MIKYYICVPIKLHHQNTSLDILKDFYIAYINNGVSLHEETLKLLENNFNYTMISAFVKAAAHDSDNNFLRVFFNRFIEKNGDRTRSLITSFNSWYDTIMRSDPISLKELNDCINFGVRFGLLDLNKNLNKYVDVTPLQNFLMKMVSNFSGLMYDINFQRAKPKKLEDMIEVIKLLMGDNFSEENRTKVLPYANKLAEAIEKTMSSRLRDYLKTSNSGKNPLDWSPTENEKLAIQLWGLSQEIINTINRPMAPPAPSSFHHTVSAQTALHDKGDYKQASEQVSIQQNSQNNTLTPQLAVQTKEDKKDQDTTKTSTNTPAKPR